MLTAIFERESQNYKTLSSLPVRASEQGNVIGLVSAYIYMCVCVCVCVCVCTKKNAIERTRYLSNLKFVATDFFHKKN